MTSAADLPLPSDDDLADAEARGVLSPEQEDLLPDGVVDSPTADVLETRVVRWIAPLFAICSIALVPWIVLLAATLPSHQLSHHYDLAWVGYDAGLAAGLATTALFALRRSPLLPVASSATGALLVADAWFDVVMSGRGSALVEAVVMAVFIELPLAAMCVWFAVHSAELAERRIVLLQRRVRRSS